MGTEISANDEWIELYNNTNLDIDLNDWKLIAKDGSPKILLSKKIPKKDFFILERTDDSVLKIPADQIYTGALNNKGEYLQLMDSQGNIIDEIDFKDNWLFGNNKTKQTMERIKSEWQTSENPEGTPKQENSKGFVEKLEKSEVPFNNQLSRFGISQNNNFVKLFSIAGSFSLCSGTSILFFKKNYLK
ncbi:MAG: lamin tail domain-containing protein [Candidatus Pacebacteria bacterium]|nr:lamin tail domain-containing protein [Candidatus Paceibacterota bacterium]